MKEKTEAREAWLRHIAECELCNAGLAWAPCEDGDALRQAALDERDLEMEIWSVQATGPIYGEHQGAQLIRTHPASRCQEDPFPCVLHSPSEHHMRDWPLVWRGDRGVMERTCAHGIGHLDPDSLGYEIRQGREWQGVHGCDGCCRPPQNTDEEEA